LWRCLHARQNATNTTSTIVSTIPVNVVSFNHRVIPAGALSRIFALNDSLGPQNYIQIYELKTYALINSFRILGPMLETDYLPAFVTCGPKGVAYTADGQIILVNGAHLKQ
jgi:hypothetical protein